jgi:phosphoglycerate dehydrogenase-like enzyme
MTRPTTGADFGVIAVRRRSGPPVVAYRLSSGQRERFRQHPSQPRLIEGAADRPVWLPPPEAEALITFASAWAQAPAEAPAGWPFGLAWIQLASAGVDALPAWAYDGPVVSAGRGVTAGPIAEYVLAVLLEEEKRIPDLRLRSRADFDRLGNEHDWPKIPLGTLAGRILGLFGLGAIGQEIARRARAFGMNILGVRRTSGAAPLDFVELRPDLAALAAESDHLVLCAPSTPETERVLDARVLAAAKPGLHIVNVARGRLVDQDALLQALDAKRLRATLDVTDPEPLPAGHPFYGHPRVRLTPHMAWYSETHHDRLTQKLLDNLGRFARGEPLAEVVDPAKRY